MHKVLPKDLQLYMLYMVTSESLWPRVREIIVLNRKHTKITTRYLHVARERLLVIESRLDSLWKKGDNDLERMIDLMRNKYCAMNSV